MAVYKDRAFSGIGGNELQQIGKLFEIRKKQREQEQERTPLVEQTITIERDDAEYDDYYDDLVTSTANVKINISIESDKDLDMIDKVYERLHKIREMYDNQD